MQQFNFEQLLVSNKGKIYRICRAYAVSPIEPQDLFQEVIYQIWKSLPSFQGNSSIDTWIYRIALNVCMRSKLKLGKNSQHTIRFDSVQFMVPEQAHQESTQEEYLVLKECIATLNESDTSIIVLYLEELSYKQIAEVTGLTENHVAVKMKRIRKKLGDCMMPKLN